MNNNPEILFFDKNLKTLIWGSEDWSISAYNEMSSIVKNGNYAGRTLKELWDQETELFGKNTSGDFPLLVKFIESHDDLSVQVHPNDDYAKKIENQPFGKTECWYIIDCEKDASIIVGQKTSCKEEFLERLNAGKWNQILNEIKIKPGDFFQINPGTIHAIKAGTKILETQQSSNLTYRLYDYNRLQNGKPRELHINKALDVIDFRTQNIQHKNYNNQSKTVTQLVSCDKFTVELLNINGNKNFINNHDFINCSVIEGTGYINDQKIEYGCSFIIPANVKNYTIKGELKIITSYI